MIEGNWLIVTSNDLMEKQRELGLVARPGRFSKMTRPDMGLSAEGEKKFF